jgi:hypothetical protein
VVLPLKPPNGESEQLAREAEAAEESTQSEENIRETLASLPWPAIRPTAIPAWTFETSAGSHILEGSFHRPMAVPAPAPVRRERKAGRRGLILPSPCGTGPSLSKNTIKRYLSVRHAIRSFRLPPVFRSYMIEPLKEFSLCQN